MSAACSAVDTAVPPPAIESAVASSCSALACKLCRACASQRRCCPNSASRLAPARPQRCTAASAHRVLTWRAPLAPLRPRPTNTQGPDLASCRRFVFWIHRHGWCVLLSTTCSQDDLGLALMSTRHRGPVRASRCCAHWSLHAAKVVQLTGHRCRCLPVARFCLRIVWHR